MKLRIPYLLAAALATASLLHLADTPGLVAAPLVTVKTIDDQQINLATPTGTARLITFWSPDCPISERNVPAMAQLQEQYGGPEFEVLAVAMPYSSEAEINSFVDSNEVDYPVAFDQDGKISDAFSDVRFTPTTFLINGEGEIVWRHVGRMTASLGASHVSEVIQPAHIAN